MEKQNNNEANNNVNANEAKPTKKKMKTSTIVIIVLAVLLLFSCVGNLGGSGSSSSSTTSSTTVTEDNSPDEKKEEAKVEEPKEEPEPEVEEQQDEQLKVVEQSDNNHINVGDTIGYSNSFVHVADAGIVNNWNNDPILFVEVEVENTIDSVLTVGNSDFSLYIDDYQIEVTTGYRTMEEFMNMASYVDINPGRKAKYVFRAVLPSDYDNASKIEVEFPDRANTPLLIKDNGVYLYGQRNVPTEENDGTDNSEERGLYESWYEEEHYNMDGLDYVLIFNHTTGGPDAEVILRADYDHQWLLWMEDERNGYLTYVEGDDKVGSIYFGTSGIEFKSDTSPELNGLYW